MSDRVLTGVPASGVDAETGSLLALMAGDPVHARDREVIVAAIVAEARISGGRVNLNSVRARLTHPKTGALTVTPVVVGAVIRSLAVKGALQAAGWTENTDIKSGNNGKPQRHYRLVALDRLAVSA
jgi:hypothetical protein